MGLKFKLLILAMCLTLIAMPVCAENIIYPPEYYSLGSMNNHYFNNPDISATYGYKFDWGDNAAGNFVSLASARGLRRQTILMEKQNELLAEQNDLIRNQTIPYRYIIEYFDPITNKTISCEGGYYK